MLNLSLHLPDKSGKQQSQRYWILTRKIPRSFDGYGIHVSGECRLQLQENLNLHASLLNELNQRNCFDSDLHLMQKDCLDIVIAGEVFRFQMKDGRWCLMDVPAVQQAKGKCVSRAIQRAHV